MSKRFSHRLLATTLPVGSVLAAFALVASPPVVQAQHVNPGPPVGWEAHSPIRIRRASATVPPGSLTPAQIRHAYGLDQVAGDGTGQVIAIVGAFDAPNIQSDFAKFCDQFGLPYTDRLGGKHNGSTSSSPTLQVSKPPGRLRVDGGWAMEAALDVQWAHVIAPQATIILFEAKTNGFNDLLSAVSSASSRAQVVSMSWGGGEFSSEAAYDSAYFSKPGVTFLAASGDGGMGAGWPSVSPSVVSVGGTTLTVDGAGSRLSETAWSGSGGGASIYLATPGYQSSLGYTRRATPDVAWDGDPASGVPVYSSTPYQGQSGWFQVGGTSAGTPQWAGLVAVANQLRKNLGKAVLSSQTQNLQSVQSAVYTNGAVIGNFWDIVSGSNGLPAAPGYDLVTGLGSPYGDSALVGMLVNW